MLLLVTVSVSYCLLLSLLVLLLLLVTVIVSYCHQLSASYVPVVGIPTLGTCRLPDGRFCGFTQPLQHVPLVSKLAAANCHSLCAGHHHVFRHCALGAVGDDVK